MLLNVEIPICKEKDKPASGSTCKYFEKTEEGEPSCVFVLLLNRRNSYVFLVLLAYMHLLFEPCIHAEPTSTVF